MKVLIYFLCLLAYGIITTYLSIANGVVLGAIPTFLLVGVALWGAHSLCKKWDEHKILKTLNKEEAERAAQNSAEVIDYSSPKKILEKAEESAAQTTDEAEALQNYKSTVKEIEELKQEMSKLRFDIGELQFSKGPIDTERISKMEDEKYNLENRVTVCEQRLSELEESKPLADLIARETERIKKGEQLKENQKLILIRDDEATTSFIKAFFTGKFFILTRDFEQVSKETAIIYNIVSDPQVGMFSEKQRLYATALIEIFSYSTNGKFTNESIAEAVRFCIAESHIKINQYKGCGFTAENANSKIINLAMQIEAMILGTSEYRTSKRALEIVLARKDNIRKTVNKIISENRQDSMYKNIAQRYLSDPDFRNTVSTFGYTKFDI